MFPLGKAAFFVQALTAPSYAFFSTTKVSSRFSTPNSLSNVRDIHFSTPKLPYIKNTLLKVISDSNNENKSVIDCALESCAKNLNLKNTGHMILDPTQLIALLNAKIAKDFYIIKLYEKKFTISKEDFLSIFFALASAGLIYKSTSALSILEDNVLSKPINCGLLFFQKHSSLEEIDLRLKNYYGSHDYNLLKATLKHLTEEMAGGVIMSDSHERFTAQEGCIWLPVRMRQQSFVENICYEIYIGLKDVGQYVDFRKKSLFDSN